jgi:hypothetical protein
MLAISAERQAARAVFGAACGLFVLLGCAAQPPQLAASGNAQLPVCAVKGGDRQSYWSEQAARLDGAFVVLAGECPSRPNSEGGAGGSGGM